jgi:hypothetical protein
LGEKQFELLLESRKSFGRNVQFPARPTIALSVFQHSELRRCLLHHPWSLLSPALHPSLPSKNGVGSEHFCTLFRVCLTNRKPSVNVSSIDSSMTFAARSTRRNVSSSSRGLSIRELPDSEKIRARPYMLQTETLASGDQSQRPVAR